MKIKYYIETLRIRTLFLSASGITLGGFLAYYQGSFNWTIFLLALLTACSLQILSNITNEYGDFLKGTDNEQRTGPSRSIQQGTITLKELKGLIFLFIFISAVSGFFLIIKSFHSMLDSRAIIMLTIGLLAILAALFYTIGKCAYGYYGFGDLFVFLFFGLVSVCGSYFLLTKSINFTILLPASSIGFLSVAVLNLNNIRDYHNDKVFNKRTICVRIGEKKAKFYHACLLDLALISMIVYTFLIYNNYKNFMFLIIIPFFIYHIIFVAKNSGRVLDKQVLFLVQATFLLSILEGLGLVL